MASSHHRFHVEMTDADKYVDLAERVWCQDDKALMPYGYPYRFVPNLRTSLTRPYYSETKPAPESPRNQPATL